MLLHPIVVIPARLASSRLFGKPLADLHGVPMVIRVYLQGLKARVGPVLVAAADSLIVEAVEQAGLKAVLTDPEHPSGSDRIYEALTLVDPDQHFNVVVNLQGDLPTIHPDTLQAVIEGLADPRIDIATAITSFGSNEEFESPNRVKALTDPQDPRLITGFDRHPQERSQAFYHIGIYAYRREVLARFVALPETPRERQHHLEQLRALDHGLTFGAAMVSDKPFAVDTPADLTAIRDFLARSVS